MKGIDHIGIAVHDLDAAIATYSRIQNVENVYRETIATQGVEAAFIKVGKQNIELISPINETSPIAKFLKKRGEGIHHVAFKTKNIIKKMDKMKAQGFRLLSEKPVIGAHQKLVCFVHPKDVHGVLIELCQKQKKTKAE
ncbi:UNVERIFIED_CONTAM: hypothetical protein GTU68_015495 [Idotea baltica]|nr:hypothetical protein [Idotea baltica]